MIWFPHLTDEALLLLADRELSTRRLSRARRHLSACVRCQTRRARIEQTLAYAVETLGNDVERSASPAELARARLARQMAEEPAQPSHFSALVVPPSLQSHRWLHAAAALILATGFALTIYGSRAPLTTGRADTSGVFLLPRADLTPGMTTPVTLQEICAPDRRGRTQPIPRSVQAAVFERYDADYRRAAEYELDYLITPELGGAADARNLWPQPFTRTPWNAFVKDELEELLHREVCKGQLELTVAQREIASDWISAYKRHFNTDTPLRDYATAGLTALDRDFILSELEELGVSAPRIGSNDGQALLTLLHAARKQSHGAPMPARLRFAVFRPVQ